MGLAWSSYKSKRKEKKDYKRYAKFYGTSQSFPNSDKIIIQHV